MYRLGLVKCVLGDREKGKKEKIHLSHNTSRRATNIVAFLFTLRNIIHSFTLPFLRDEIPKITYVSVLCILL